MHLSLSTALALAYALASAPADDPACPVPGLGMPELLELVAEGEPAKPFLAGTSVEYSPDTGATLPFGSALVRPVPSSAIGQQFVLLQDATLVVDTAGAHVTRIWYDDTPVHSGLQFLQLDDSAPWLGQFFLVAPEEIAGRRVFHSYQTPSFARGRLDLVGPIEELRIGAHNLRVESICTIPYSCDSTEDDLRAALWRRSRELQIRPRTACVEVELLGTEPRILESITFEGLTRDLQSTFTIGAVVYEVDPKAPSTGTLLEDRVMTSGRLDPGPIFGTLDDPQAARPPLFRKDPITVGFGDLLLEPGKRYRIGLGRAPGSSEADRGFFPEYTVDEVHPGVFEYVGSQGMFLVTGTYRSDVSEFPTEDFKFNVIGEQFVPRIKIRSRCL